MISLFLLFCSSIFSINIYTAEPKGAKALCIRENLDKLPTKDLSPAEMWVFFFIS